MTNMLTAFPELVRTYEVFKMEPFTVGGYGERYDKRKVSGYWSWRKQAKADFEGDLNVPNHQATFWVQSWFAGKKVFVRQNDFVEINDEIFRVVSDQDFTVEGGFIKCLMQKLAGPTDRQVTNGRVDGVIAEDY